MNKCCQPGCENPVDKKWFLNWLNEIVQSTTCSEHKGPNIAYYHTKQEVIAATVEKLL